MTDKLQEVEALIVHQWLKEWDDVYFTILDLRQKPAPNFYLFALPAFHLRKLSAVYRRKADKPRPQDTAIQRAHEKERSEEIRRYIHGGFPLSVLPKKQIESSEYRDLRMPGWLPTAIVVNIIPPNSIRDDHLLLPEHAIKIEYQNDTWVKLVLPKGYERNDWTPTVPPIEIIDGQHRLFAFEDDDRLDGCFNLPVVAFHDLDFTWKAYLFYTINIKPKKINISLAYDLYPLLRVQDWLEKSPDGPVIYRETRSQELTEVLWSHPQSPWKGRINMLGEKKGGDVTQAAFIRSLLTSYVKRGGAIGGLFGDELSKKKGDVLQWSRVKQAAFIIVIWKRMEEAIRQTKLPWAQSLRGQTVQKKLPIIDEVDEEFDLAFAGGHSLLATDQGVRGLLTVTNDMCFLGAEQLGLKTWMLQEDISYDALNTNSVNIAIASLEDQKVNDFLKLICQQLALFDWRTSSAPGVFDDETQRRAQMVFKGSSGYKELRSQLINLLCLSEDQLVRSIAAQVKTLLRY
jgi:DGQHR domain-containing protein